MTERLKDKTVMVITYDPERFDSLKQLIESHGGNVAFSNNLPDMTPDELVNEVTTQKPAAVLIDGWNNFSAVAAISVRKTLNSVAPVVVSNVSDDVIAGLNRQHVPCVADYAPEKRIVHEICDAIAQHGKAAKIIG